MATKKELVATGEFNLKEKKESLRTKEELKAMMPNLQARAAELLTGRFINNQYPDSRNPLSTVKFGFKKFGKYRFWKLEHNQVYTLPREVVEHLKKDCMFCQYEPLRSPTGAKNGLIAGATDGMMQGNEMYVVNRSPRFSFVGLDFDDSDLVTPSMTEVRLKMPAI